MKIKVTCTENVHLERMIPSSVLSNMGIEFIINNPSQKECDAWFIFDCYGLSIENEVICPSENVFFVMGECEQIHIYKKKFVGQFSNLITAQKYDYGKKNVIKDYFACWFVGLSFSPSCALNSYRFNYEELFSMKPIKKNKLLSVISSNKNMSVGHRQRLEFIDKLKQHFGDQVDIYGRGIRDFEDKWDVLAPYKYHIAIENQKQDFYITEKLHDPFLAFCFPLYYGAQNASDYFEDKSFLAIDILDVKKTIERIESLIESDPYDNLLENVIRSRLQVLNDQNMFIKMANLALKCRGTEKRKILIRDESDFYFSSKIKRILCLR